MRRALLAALLASMGAVPLAAQSANTLTLSDETPLHAEPASASTVKATLPSGLEVTVLSERDGWIAVMVSADVSGWITASGSSPERIGALGSPADGNSPPPPPVTGASDRTVPPPPSSSSASTLPPPPPAGMPPPPAPAVDAEDVEDGESLGGLYDVHSWSRFHFDTQESVQAVGAQYGVMLSNLGEFEANLIGSRTSVSSDDMWGLDLTLRYNLYFLQPSETLPVGAYGSALGSFAHLFPPEGETTVGLFDEPQGDVFRQDGAIHGPQAALSTCTCALYENTVRYGGEGGLFARLDAGSLVVIPRLAYRWSQQRPVGEESAEPFSFSTLVAGADFLFGRVAPGFSVARTEEVNLISVALAFPF